ncbi:uncharacterized protein LOC119366273 [Triticum dicoccoides]|uniref:uncharacterized protein LOC119366273 n=1 Tax=Triticum dicoccoides TaxID=85692 RepID=UPI000E7AD1AD|nr:uncharacterized protein LOC119366273 [Triticum dicoccoides]XP_037487868.1 uncharacterized protein LOC119366273 [Triticum dicoccoides]XP_037487869.1 uncharacterized protein LOC119366273 [Triticum dicoccoides]
MQPMEGVLVALASYGATMLAEMAKDKLAIVTRVSGEIDDLGVKLMYLKNFLADANRRGIADESMRRWVEELKHAMYDDVTDILDQCRHKVTE